MAKDPQPTKPSTRTILTGTAQSVTNSVERAREYFKGHAEPTAPPKERKNFRRSKPTGDQVEEPNTEPDDTKPERAGEREEGED